MKIHGSILVAAGYEGVRRFTGVLTAEGYDVRVAACAEEVLASVTTSHPRLILLDVDLKPIDGFEALRRLRASPKTRRIPTILISSSPAADERAKGLALGAVDFLEASVGPEELLARVRTHLRQARLLSAMERVVRRRTAALDAALGQLGVEVKERRRVATAMRENQEFMLLAMKAGRSHAFEWNPRTDEVRRSYHSSDLLEMAGDTQHENWGEFIMRVHPDDREELQRRIRELTPAHDTVECDYRIAGSASKIVYLHAVIRGFFNHAGEPERYIGIVADTTQARRAEAALYESEERFRVMADTAPMMICSSGPDRLATYFNKAWLTFTGRRLEQELGFGWAEGLHQDDRDRALTGYSASFSTLAPCRLEYRLRRADGEYRWIVCNGTPRWTADAIFAGYIASCIDVTDLRRAQEEAFDKQRLDSLRLLTGGISHDFNSLLSGILAQTELARADIVEGMPPLAAIRQIRTAATRAAEIVRELMIYSGQDQFTLEPVHLSRVVNEMLALLKVSISKHATLRTELANDLPAVLGSTTQMRQVVMNLIINASDAIGETDGTIRIVTSRVTLSGGLAPDNASLPEGDFVRLEISDTGCGMTEEATRRIFDPFFTTKAGGHGLGMAVVQGIVHSHSGVVNVKTAVGRGTTFEVLLPVARELAGRGSAGLRSSSVERSLPEAKTVLLIEQEESLRISVGKALRKRGFSIRSAAECSAALDVLRDHAQEIDAVVLDLTSTSDSARETLRQIRLMRDDLPVILTGVEDESGRSGDDSQKTSFLRKPYRIVELVEQLRKSLLTEAAANPETPRESIDAQRDVPDRVRTCAARERGE